VSEGSVDEMFRCIHFTYKIVCDGKRGLFICGNREVSNVQHVSCAEIDVNWCFHSTNSMGSTINGPCKRWKERPEEQPPLEAFFE